MELYGYQIESMKEAGYRHVGRLEKGIHVLRDEETGIYEVFFANKNHAGWCIKYKSTHLEFAREASPLELEMVGIKEAV